MMLTFNKIAGDGRGVCAVEAQTSCCGQIKLSPWLASRPAFQQQGENQRFGTVFPSDRLPLGTPNSGKQPLLTLNHCIVICSLLLRHTRTRTMFRICITTPHGILSTPHPWMLVINAVTEGRGEGPAPTQGHIRASAIIGAPACE